MGNKSLDPAWKRGPLFYPRSLSGPPKPHRRGLPNYFNHFPAPKSWCLSNNLMPKPTARKPRSRTFTGCLTCRGRKVKCSLEHPACANCKRLNLECAGYDAVLSWMPIWNPNHGNEDEPAGCEKKQDGGRRARSEIFSSTVPHPFCGTAFVCKWRVPMLMNDRTRATMSGKETAGAFLWRRQGSGCGSPSRASRRRGHRGREHLDHKSRAPTHGWSLYRLLVWQGPQY